MKKNVIIILIVLAAVIITTYTLTKDKAGIDEELAKCIEENSVLYVRTGCSACEAQKDLFGKSYQYLTAIDCLTQAQECANNGISSIPTWIINGQRHVGVQSIDKLKSLTNCQ